MLMGILKIKSLALNTTLSLQVVEEGVAKQEAEDVEKLNLRPLVAKFNVKYVVSQTMMP
ncbi:hypothetical protein TSUD_84530 [Trifolium subterraneum]|uniref:Uncharacterized protein n=1 Tax=Trifolium subterraneum TaxID=3900 RepID=A0A2Z6NP09_TRISU|nr:hypothetical protein TSUD_84530 [Trifolium subterraneum]